MHTLTAWEDTQKRFQAIVVKAGGPSKGSSGTIDVQFGSEGVSVSFGGYDIPSWSRHHYLGTFKTEQEAHAATIKAVDEAEREVERELALDADE